MSQYASLQPEQARALVEQICSSDTLPSVPVVAANVMALSKDPDVDFGRLGAMIGADPALVAKILRMANSAFFGARRKITSTNEALVRMGLKVTRMSVLGFTLEGEISKKVPENFGMDRFWRHSLTTATAARILAETVWPAKRDDAFAAGILQDIGMVAIQCALPDKYPTVFEERRLHPTAEIYEIELRVVGVTHMEVGGRLLQKWGIPEEVFAPVRYHHFPMKARDEKASDDVAKLAELLGIASDVARLFHYKAKGMTQMSVTETAKMRFGLSHMALDRVLERTAEGVREICDLFNLDPRTIPSYGEIRVQAAQEVAKLAIEIGHEAQSAENRAQEHVAEVRQLKAEAEELKRLASQDELTTLLNRREFLKSFVAEISRSRRHEHNLGLLIFDIDHFKHVNDTYGHPTGDKVLAALGHYLTSEVRRSDLAARLGGEEFVVLLPETDVNGVVAAAEKLRLGVAEASKNWAPGVPGITVSVGAVHVKHDSASLDGSVIIDEADRCLYQAKSSGRNCTRYASL